MHTPLADGFTMPSEWHKHAACWMAWPCHALTWSGIGWHRAYAVYARVARAISLYEPVIMIVNPQDITIAREYCGDNISLFPLLINDSWLRDTGPTFLLNPHQQLAGVDWIHNAWGNNYTDYHLDDKIAAVVIKHVKARYFKAPLIMEGGSFHVDGEGTILTTRECLLNPNRNPQLSQLEIETFLCDYLNAKKIIWLNHGLFADETNGHVDEIASFIAPGKVIALMTYDKTDVNYTALQENFAILRNSVDAQGRKLEIFLVEQPPATYWKNKRLTLSYINFYLANQGVVIPAFGYPEYDKKAYALFKQLLPQHNISQIEVKDLVTGGGGIHCITQQQPVSTTPVNGR